MGKRRPRKMKRAYLKRFAGEAINKGRNVNYNKINHEGKSYFEVYQNARPTFTMKAPPSKFRAKTSFAEQITEPRVPTDSELEVLAQIKPTLVMPAKWVKGNGKGDVPLPEEHDPVHPRFRNLIRLRQGTFVQYLQEFHKIKLYEGKLGTLSLYFRGSSFYFIQKDTLDDVFRISVEYLSREDAYKAHGRRSITWIASAPIP